MKKASRTVDKVRWQLGPSQNLTFTFLLAYQHGRKVKMESRSIKENATFCSKGPRRERR